MGNFEELREAYYSIEIGNNDNAEPVWIKKLRNILNEDIHNKPLGCKINNLHIKIGDVHLSAFYEAEIIFSHAKWVSRFANWIYNELKEFNNILIIGYETYIEPVLSLLSNKLNAKYCIYEEPKFIQYSTMSKPRLRYEDNLTEFIKEKNMANHKIILICGISSTLSTYKKLEQCVKNYDINSLINKENFLYYSIVQVLPSNINNTNNLEFILNDNDDILSWNEKEKIAKRNNQFDVKYLVDVKCDWFQAQNCEWCFPNIALDEKPLVTTGDSSVIPLQMIGLNCIKDFPKLEKSKNNFNLFEKNRKGDFKYKNYLYYNHIDRDGHHFQYYIRTGALFNNILTNNFSKFSAFCNKLRDKLINSDNDVNIIVAPLHFSNERFPQEINRLVFNNRAHLISFDSKKEYRSNFEAKYSNYAYVLAQIERINILPSADDLTKNIQFHFVDDQIITGRTFYKAKSFVSSLIRKFTNSKSRLINYKIFASVITFIDRNSQNSKLNYVENLGNFFSFIDIPIPSIRNYGDSCPLCKQISESKNISQNCTLSFTSNFWNEKVKYHRVKSIEEARKLSNTLNESIKTRNYTRFYCEYQIWNNIKNIWEEDKVLKQILDTIFKTLKTSKNIKIQYEYLISFIKVLSRPLIYYREYVKKAVLKLLLSLIEYMLDSDPKSNEYPLQLIEKINENLTKTSTHKKANDTPINTVEKQILDYEKYCLLCMLITCLSNIESCYLLDTNHIVKLCVFVQKLNSNCLSFGKITFVKELEVEGFYSIIANNMKKLICGTSGIEKSKHFNTSLQQSVQSPYSSLFEVLNLENIYFNEKNQEHTNIKEKIKEIQENKTNTIIEKYELLGEICKQAAKAKTCSFYLSYGTDLHNSKIAEIFGNTRLGSFDLILQQISTNANIEDIQKQLFSVGYFKIQNSVLVMLDDHLINSSYCKDNVMLLLVSFEHDIRNNYKNLKNLLIHRKQISDLIQDDIKTGAIESAVRAKAAELLLSTDKTQSHGRFKDINQLFELAYEAYYNDKKNNLEFYRRLNLFMNRCIASGYTRQILEEYFFIRKSFSNPFFARLAIMDGKMVLDSLKEYFIDLNGTYLEQLKSEFNRSRNDNIRIIFKSDIDNSNNIGFVPSFINVTSKYESSPIMLIGLIDILIRNAIQHGDKNSKIQVEINAKQEENTETSYIIQSYAITVKNPCTNQKYDKEGFTKKFFTTYLSKNKDVDSYFYINMDRKEKQYISEIICSKKDLLDNQ